MKRGVTNDISLPINVLYAVPRVVLPWIRASISLPVNWVGGVFAHQCFEIRGVDVFRVDS